MNSQLFLTSYFAGTKHLFNTFTKELVDKRVLFIPTAANVEEYTKYVDEALLSFESLGFEIHILDISITKQEDIINYLNEFPCLYISGGNTFYLLQELKNKNIIEIIKQRIKQGLIYIGESAGAIITAKDISYTECIDEKNKAPMLQEFSALSLVDFYILPHYKEFPFIESVDNTIKKYSGTLNLLPINNHQAIIVNNESYKIYE